MGSCFLLDRRLVFQFVVVVGGYGDSSSYEYLVGQWGVGECRVWSTR